MRETHKLTKNKLTLTRKVLLILAISGCLFGAYYMGIRGLFSGVGLISTAGRFTLGHIIPITNPQVSVFVSLVNFIFFCLTGLGLFLWGFQIFPPACDFFQTVNNPKLDPKLARCMKIYYSTYLLVFIIYLGTVILAPLWNISQYPAEIHHIGVIRENDTSCAHDGVCRIKVDNYWVITDLGGDPTLEMEKQRGPRGQLILPDNTLGLLEIFSGKTVIGSNVEVYAKHVKDNVYTLYGDKKYYLKFL